MYYIVCYSVYPDAFTDHTVNFNHSDSVIDFLISNEITNCTVYRVYPHKGNQKPTITGLGKCRLRQRLQDLGIFQK